MIAKIGRGSNLHGALVYNQLKVEKGKGEILFANKIIETPDGYYTVSQLAQSFEPYLIANRNTEKPILHISLNPDPKDNVSDNRYKEMAEQYMREMGYGEQPFVVFKHTDIDRTHIHIVSVCVDGQGKKISDKFEKRHSMNVCRELENKFGLIAATDKIHSHNDSIFHPVDYRSGDLKSQIASVVRQLPKYYQFQTMGEYNALLSLFNITAEEVKGELHGNPKQGLVYFVLNENGTKASNSFKSSLFGKAAGHQQLQIHFEQSGKTLKESDAGTAIKKTIEDILQSVRDEQDFRKQLTAKGMNVVVRRNDSGRIYGITFIDHNSKTVWNGSRLGKELSANVFNHWWNNEIKPESKTTENTETILAKATNDSLPDDKPYNLFDFLNNEDTVTANSEHSSIEAFGGLLPEAQGEDYEEQVFADRLRKKKKRRNNNRNN